MKRYVHANIVNISEDSIEARLEAARNPNIREATWSALINDPDPRVRYVLQQNEAVPEDVRRNINLVGDHLHEVELTYYMWGELEALFDAGVESQIRHIVQALGGDYKDYTAYGDEDIGDVKLYVSFNCFPPYDDDIADAILSYLKTLGFEVDECVIN